MGAAVLVPVVTGNADLIPSVILLGSFLVPVSFVMYALGRTDAVVTAQRVFTAFAIGALLGVPDTSVLESEFPWATLRTGLPRCGGDRGSGQAGRAVGALPSSAALHRARRDGPG